MTYEKVVRELEFANIDLTRESGNMGEIRKALDSFEDLNKKQNESYKELEEEMEITQVKGGGQARRKIQSELD